MIRLEDLTKEYDLPPLKGSPAQVTAANHLNFQIPEGELYGLVGPNGAGKTTTMKMVCGLIVPTSGRVLVHGVDVERQPEEAQRYIGYLADFFSLYDDLKVWEYLDYFAHAYRIEPTTIPGRISQAIERMGLETKRDAFIGGLSRGMKQRLGIAHAILHDPPLLVLDEPAAGLDPKARAELKQLLKELNGAGKTVLISSHVLSDLEEICTSVAIMEKGRLLRVGKLSELMREAAGSGGAARRVRIQLAASRFPLAAWLAARPGVSGVLAADASAKPGRASCEFAFAGSDAELADLVRDLVAAGAPVCGVEALAETFEQVFVRLSSGEVM